MRNFYSAADPGDLDELIKLASEFKKNPLKYKTRGQNKLLVLLFFNPSLRTRLSTQKAAFNLGMDVISMDMKESWAWEIDRGSTMKFDTAEHIIEAAGVISRYADIIGLRCFPSLTDKERDAKDELISTFIKYASKPVINLESNVRHPLQSFADLYTIREFSKTRNPKIVLTWAPHPKALPQAVANSFLEWMHRANYPVTVTHPPGYELSAQFMKGHSIQYDQSDALKDADFVYVKNWSSVSQYGKIISSDPSWMMTKSKLDKTNKAKMMHCLPVRRNVVIADDALDSDYSIVQELAENRLYTAQSALYSLLSHQKDD